jgi:membrane protease YdiL (CAAX protease family)
MSDTSPPPATSLTQPPPRPPWGYFATFGLALLAQLVGAIAGILAVIVWNRGALQTVATFEEAMKDAGAVCLSTVVTAPVLIAVLVWAARMKNWTARDYLALVPPSRRDLMIAIGCLVVLLPLLDAMSWLIGEPIIPPFQTELYANAQKAGVVPLVWLAIVVAAPIGEEIMFRGFIFRGWVRSPRSAIPAILAIAVLFAVIHVQYNLYGIMQVLALGLLLTFFRWCSGSTVLTIVLHAIANFYAMVQTVVQAHWLS